MNECGCVPIKLYLMTLEFESIDMHVSRNIFLTVFQPLKKMEKPLLAHEPY
jgi:hypothetical protein